MTRDEKNTTTLLKDDGGFLGRSRRRTLMTSESGLNKHRWGKKMEKRNIDGNRVHTHLLRTNTLHEKLLGTLWIPLADLFVLFYSVKSDTTQFFRSSMVCCWLLFFLVCDDKSPGRESDFSDLFFFLFLFFFFFFFFRS